MTHFITTDRQLLNRLQDKYNRSKRNPLRLDDLIGKITQQDSVSYLRSFPDDSVDFVFTDEPYGVAGTRLNLKARSDITTDFEWDRFDEFWQEPIVKDLLIEKNQKNMNPRGPLHLVNEWVYEAERILKPHGFLVNFGMSEFSGSFRDVCVHAGLVWRASGPWIKTNVAPHFRKVNFRSGYEFFFVASKGTVSKENFHFMEQQEMVNFLFDAVCPNCGVSHPISFSNAYDKPSWWNKVGEWGKEKELPDWMNEKFAEYLQFCREQENYAISPIISNKTSTHGTEKPEWLATKFIEIFTNKGDLVIDPYCGSGSHLAVAKRLGRKFSGNDLSEEWSHSARQRLEGIGDSYSA